jgi:hypothetical protein
MRKSRNQHCFIGCRNGSAGVILVSETPVVFSSGYEFGNRHFVIRTSPPATFFQKIGWCSISAVGDFKEVRIRENFLSAKSAKRKNPAPRENQFFWASKIAMRALCRESIFVPGSGPVQALPARRQSDALNSTVEEKLDGKNSRMCLRIT